MIQDIAPKIFANEFKTEEITDDSRVILFEERTVLIHKTTKEELLLPTYKELTSNIQGCDKKEFQYVFAIDNESYFIQKPTVKHRIADFLSYTYENISTIRQVISKEVCFAVMNAFHLYVWYNDNKYCGRCGHQTEHSNKERMLHCPECNNAIYPKIAPAVIVGLVHGDRILMSKYADREYKKYALLAGFNEFGETAEETVAREVFEEVGLHVKRMKYYKSQPWGVDSNLLLGYFAELDGSEDITMDTQELAVAEWFDRKDIPLHNDGISLTTEMIRFFENEDEFKKWYRS